MDDYYVILYSVVYDVVNNDELYSNSSLFDECFSTCNNDKDYLFFISFVSDVIDNQMFTISKSNKRETEKE